MLAGPRRQGKWQASSTLDIVVDGYAVAAAEAADVARCVFRRAVGDVFDSLARPLARSGLKLGRKEMRKRENLREIAPQNPHWPVTATTMDEREC